MAIAVVVAGGKGQRMGTVHPKQYLELAGRPILTHTLTAVAACTLIERIYLVIAPRDETYCRQHVLQRISIGPPLTLVFGGSERQDSVYRGLQTAEPYRGVVVIHDGVRPLVEAELLTRCIQTAQRRGACIAAVPVTDTLKKTDDNHVIVETLQRNHIWQAQTPQAFDFELLLKAHRRAARTLQQTSDDATLLERNGHAVAVTTGSRCNIKITTPEDLRLAEALLATTPLPAAG